MPVYLISALTTGGFCAVFAVFVNAVADMLSLGHVVVISAVSGFLGSLFAHFVLNRGAKK